MLKQIKSNKNKPLFIYISQTKYFNFYSIYENKISPFFKLLDLSSYYFI